MAKDALGHGSEANGAHSMQINNPPAKMTRAHFEQLAAQLRGQAATDPAGHDARVNAFADHLSTTNPGFRRDLFMKASQPGTAYRDKSTRSITKGNASKALGKYRTVSNTGFGMSTRVRPETRERTGADMLSKYRS